MSRSGRGKASQQKQQQGTRRDRLLFRAFCPKHSRERYPPAAAPAAGAKRPYEQQRQQQQQQPALLQAPCSAARAVPFNPAARRGQRAPEAEAAALAKRQFMRATPYLVGLPMQSGAAELPESVCHLRPPTAAAVKKPETAAAAGEQQQEHTEQERQEQHQQPEEQQQQAQEQPQADEPQQRERRQQQPWFPGTLLTVDAEGGQPGSPPAGQQRVGWRPIRGLQSEADRFAKMVATQGQRVTIGKSAIHGWGGFAKRAHRAREGARDGLAAGLIGGLACPLMNPLAWCTWVLHLWLSRTTVAQGRAAVAALQEWRALAPGSHSWQALPPASAAHSPCPLPPLHADDMVIEYVGELVRHSVSDLRQAGGEAGGCARRARWGGRAASAMGPHLP